MVKKVVTKTVTETNSDKSLKKSRKKSPSSKPKQMSSREREELLIENFVGLQHAMTNLSMKFGNLSQNIQTLLQIFEEAAKNFMQGPNHVDNAGMLKKIDSLLDQNKTIAKGLVLMEENLRRRPNLEEQRHEFIPPNQGFQQTFRENNPSKNNYGSSPEEPSRIKPKPLPRI
jgi:hypothetical protein